jgi:ArsR family transcriptional regulator
VNGKHSLNNGTLVRSTVIFKALSNPTRLKIALILSRGDRTVSDLADALGVKQCIVSQQLGLLRMNGIVRGVNDKGHVRYSLIDRMVTGLIRDLDRCKTDEPDSIHEKSK